MLVYETWLDFLSGNWKSNGLHKMAVKNITLRTVVYITGWNLNGSAVLVVTTYNIAWFHLVVKQFQMN
jgi:hypothetical protein